MNANYINDSVLSISVCDPVVLITCKYKAVFIVNYECWELAVPAQNNQQFICFSQRSELQIRSQIKEKGVKTPLKTKTKKSSHKLFWFNTRRLQALFLVLI